MSLLSAKTKFMTMFILRTKVDSGKLERGPTHLFRRIEPVESGCVNVALVSRGRSSCCRLSGTSSWCELLTTRCVQR